MNLFYVDFNLFTKWTIENEGLCYRDGMAIWSTISAYHKNDNSIDTQLLQAGYCFLLPMKVVSSLYLSNILPH